MKIIFLSLLLALAGCSGISRMNTIQAPLSVQSGVYVPIGSDGSHGGVRQPMSGYIVAEQMYSAVQLHMHQVRAGAETENFDEALLTAQRLSLRYMVYTTILDWKDEATPMASIEDAVQVKIQFIDVSDGSVIDAAVLAKESSCFVTEKTGPQQLLAAPLKKYIDDVFEQSADLAAGPGFFTKWWH
jgi:hypothetical protein